MYVELVEYRTQLVLPSSKNPRDVHNTAKQGFQQGSFYDKNRPSYTDETANRVIQLIRDVKTSTDSSKSNYDILELGAGTGKFTKKLAERLTTERLLATEPSESFLKVLKENCPEVDSKMCAANDIPLPDNSVKGVVCAQCFHWFANLTSLTEINRVLIPGGVLALVYNQKDSKFPKVAEMSDKIQSYMGDNPPPQHLDMKWREVFNQVKTIQHVEDTILDGIHCVGTAESILDNIFSVSYMNNLPDEEKTKAKEEIKKILIKHEGDIEGRSDIHIPYYSIIHLYAKQLS